MLTQIAHWHPYRGALIAFATTLVLALAGRFLRIGLLAASAGGAGVLAGWYAITGRFWVNSPSVSVDVLTQIAGIALIIGLLCTWRGSRWLTLAGMLLVALATGWFLSGGPRTEPALWSSWPIGLAVTLAVLLFVRMATDRALEPIRLALGGITLALAFHVAGTPPAWTQLALVLAVAAFGMLALPPMPALVGLPVATDIAALACLAAVVLGRLPRLGFAAVDAAALSPLLAVWLQPLVTSRVGFAGRLASCTGSVVAGTIAMGCVWLVRVTVGR